MPKILRRLRINEVSSVDRGAGEGVKIMLMKREEEPLYNFANWSDAEPAAEYLKREFSAEQRRSAASSGAALPDGSFPIHNKSDLHNAMQAIGRAKDPAKAKAHIRRRAKALGLSGELSDAFKHAPVGERVADFFADLFKREPERDARDGFEAALAGLAESVKSIMDDEADVDREDMLAKTFTQFHEHVSPLLGDRALQQPTDKKELPMSAILKALGLQDDASEEDALKAIAAMIEKQRGRRNGNGNGDKEEEEEDDEEEKKEKARRRKDEEDEEKEEKALLALPAGIRKQIADGKDAIERVKKLEDAAALIAFNKRAVDVGLPEAEGVTLQKAYAGDREAIDKLLTLTKSGFAAAKEAGAFKEFGGTGLGGGGTAYDQFAALAQKYLKDHPGEKLTPEQAFSKVYTDPANKSLRIQDARESGRAA
jgi:hypothetical protein